jgi:hypothetical protein
MDLITIKREPIEVPPSQRIKRRISLTHTNAPGLQQSINSFIQDGIENGYPLHRMTFENGHVDSGGEEYPPTCIIELSRMETEEETAARVQRQEAYNQREIKAHQDKLASVARKKELERITGHLTLEQLQALPTIEPEQSVNHWLP